MTDSTAAPINPLLAGPTMLAASLKGLDTLATIWLIGLAIVLVMVGLSFAAFVLKTACRLVGAEVPDTGKAMVVSFLESLCCGMAYMLSLLAVFLLGKAVNADKAMMVSMASLSILVLAFAVPAGLYVPMLRVSFQKGLALSVLRYVITMSIFLAFGLAIGAATGKYKLH
jgi:hypothetical protein